jgi:hypothetical protein
VLVHLGASNYLQRYTTYVTHVQQWRQQFDKLESVDLRYDGQIIVNPDLNGLARQPALTPAAAKAAMAAGVKTAAIINYEKYVTHPVVVTPAKVTNKKDAMPSAKTAAKVAPNKSAGSRAAVKPAPAQVAIKPKNNLVTVARHTSASRPSSTPVASASVPAGHKKPSAAVPKETPQH